METFMSDFIVVSIRGAQAGVFELDIRIYNQPYIDVCE
jgi:hypothetical protein